jgi:hypothetical protein
VDAPMSESADVARVSRSTGSRVLAGRATLEIES